MRQSSSEMDLIGRMQAGDTAAVGELASMYGPRIQQLAFRYVKNWEDAEEVAQDVLLKVYRKINGQAARPILEINWIGAYSSDFASPSYQFTDDYDITLQKIAGADRDFHWAIERVVP